MFDPLRECVCGEFILPLDRHYGYFLFTIAGSFYNVPYNILAFLSQNVGKVMTYSAIIRSIWGSMDQGSIKKLQVNMANIRKKLGCRPGQNRYVINELGVGYRMLDENE